MRRAFPVRGLQGVTHMAALGQLDVFVRYRRAGDVVVQVFQPLTIVRAGPHACVRRKTMGWRSGRRSTGTVPRVARPADRRAA